MKSIKEIETLLELAKNEVPVNYNSLINTFKNSRFKITYENKQYTSYNRNAGISIGCYDKQIDRLKYPLKLVSCSYKGSYEDLDTPSYSDPNQGFGPIYRE